MHIEFLTSLKGDMLKYASSGNFRAYRLLKDTSSGYSLNFYIEKEKKERQQYRSTEPKAIDTGNTGKQNEHITLSVEREYYARIYLQSLSPKFSRKF